jgi:cytochrome c
MKKLFIILAVTGFTTWTMTSCGPKKEEAKTEEEAKEDGYSDYETAEPEKASDDDLIKQGQALIESNDCKTCHHNENKLVGPPYNEVAKKYEFTKANVSLLSGKVISGGSGTWGDIPMTAHPDLSKGDAEKMAMYVLSLDGEKPKD